MSKYKIGLVSLGCDKNRIDSEIILGQVNKEYEITNNPKEADIIIVNTCGFIEKSKQESIDTILEMARYKKNHNCKLLIATGCLTQRYGEELIELMPEIDILLGVNDYIKLNSYIMDFINNDKKTVSCDYSDIVINEGERILTTQGNTAYIRISEGCDNFCTYCIIPKIRGKYRSRPMDRIIKEAKVLSEKGIKEIILVAQDTTRYGEDLYGKKSLTDLIKKLSLIDEIKWIRVLYCYPEQINDELIEEIANNLKVCKYLDMPIQHISNSVLKKMGRRTDKESIINVLNKLKNKIPNIVIRTSIIVGFPGETEDDFNELKEFIKKYTFDKLGVFTYSQEEGTPAAIMKDQIYEEVKCKREQELMLIQKDISANLNSKKLERIYEVIVEGFNDEYYYGRSMELTPEIDGTILFKSEKSLENGSFVNVKIIESLEYDLIGVVHHESCK